MRRHLLFEQLTRNNCCLQTTATDARVDRLKREKARAERQIRQSTDDIIARLDACATRQYLEMIGVYRAIRISTPRQRSCRAYWIQIIVDA